jgi:outer membrane lipoprotein-sorting protein
MKQWLVLAISFLLIPLSIVGAQQMKMDEVVQRLKENREKIKNFSADLLQEKKIFLLKEKVVSKGRISEGERGYICKDKTLDFKEGLDGYSDGDG